MLGTSWPCPTSRSSPPPPSGPASVRARRLRISLVAALLVVGCKNIEIVDDARLDPMAPTIPASEYHRVAKAIFKRAITSFANEQWDRVITDGGKIEQTALRWQKEPADRTKEKEHDAATSGLAAAGRKLAAAAEAKEAAAVSNALGMVAERLAQLKIIDPMGAAEAEKPPARPATTGAGANGAAAPKAPAAGPEATVPPVSPRTPILPPGDPGKK